MLVYTLFSQINEELDQLFDRPKSGSAKEVTTIIARAVAPLRSHRNMFVNNSDASQTG
jgi:hypothetical protein